ncbi:MAG: hypothetical protein ACYC7E_03665 [Armatimonadota bacterium]
MRLNALLALHPHRALLADIDARVEGLRRQRAHVLQQSSLTTPPPESVFPTPPLAALPAPEPSPVTGVSSHKVNQQDLKALSRTLRNETERQYERQARGIRAEYDRALQARLVQIERVAADSRRLLDEQYRDVLLGEELRMGLMSKSTPRTSIRQRPGAAATVTTPPTILEKISLLRDDPRRSYAAGVSKIDAELIEARKIAEQENKRALMERLQNLRQQLEESLRTRIDEEVARLDIGEEGAVQPAPLPPMSFQEIPGGSLRVTADSMAHEFAAANVRTAQGRQETVRAIDRSIAELLAQRRQVQAEMRVDTRKAVESLAIQHGYRVSIDARAGEEITAAMRGWLAAYWPPVPYR